MAETTSKSSNPLGDDWRSILAPMPRRPWMADIARGRAEPRIRSYRAPSPPVWLVLARSFAWAWAGLRYALARFVDRLRRDTSDRRRGVRLRKFFENLGGAGVKIGQQMSMRLDFLPYDVCRELDRLLDHMGPFPLPKAIETIEATLGRKYTDVFLSIEKQPIGSASIACVWQGVLHSGQRVAIKVRRPDIEEMFGADLALVDALTLTLELSTIVRPGFFRNLRSELRDMFTSELDFAQEASHQTLFRRVLRKDRIDWADAPVVYAELSSAEVLVTELIEGVSCLDFLRAVEAEDETSLRDYRAMELDPELVGRRILDMARWMRLEAPFFHGDPHPGNIILLPGNKLMFLDFGTCGFITGTQRGDEFELTRRLMTRDVPGATAVAIGTLSPLPDVDVPRLRRTMERVFWLRSIDARSGQAHWWERTTAAIWVAMIEALRKFRIPVNIRSLRQIRSSLLYDTLAFRLAPELDVVPVWRDWLKNASKREKRRRRRRKKARARVAPDSRATRFDELRETLERAAYVVDHLLRNVPKEFVASTGKAAFLFSSILRFSGYLLLLIVISGIGSVVSEAGLVVDLATAKDLLVRGIEHPAGAIAFFVLIILIASRVRARLDEAE